METIRVIFTDAAADATRNILEKLNVDAPGIRLQVIGGGCSGFSYDIQPVEEINDDDWVEETKGMKLVIDPISLMYVDDSMVDYVTDLMGSRFHIDNPNITTKCGCGNSFGV